MAKKTKSMIGHDPLAWLKDDDAEEQVAEKSVPEKKEPAKKTTAKKKAAKSKTVTAKSDGDVLVINSVQDVSAVVDLYEQAKKLLSASSVVIEGGGVERIDAASLQLLYFFIDEAKSKGIAISWKEPSDVLVKSAKLLGMQDVLLLNEAA